MGLARDLSDLPRAEPEALEGEAPDAAVRFGDVLVRQWAHEDHRAGEKATATGTRLRHSDAGKCSRRLSYVAAGIPRSDPEMDLPGTWNTRLGTMIHEEWQAALLARYPDAGIEVVASWDDLDASGHIDFCVSVDGHLIVGELKVVGGYAYKSAVGRAHKGLPATGPKPEHRAQVALNAAARGADEAVLVYLAKETLSLNYSDVGEVDRMIAEWTYGPETFGPWAEAEADRMAGILNLVDREGRLAARKVPAEMPPGAEITNVDASFWERRDPEGVLVDMGSVWNGSMCLYCPWHTLCRETEPGRVEVADVVRLVPTGTERG